MKRVCFSSLTLRQGDAGLSNLINSGFADEGEKAQMKTEWDSYLDQQLANPAVRQAYEEETKILSIGTQLARQRKRKGMTQAELARKIGTSTPQLSRTERRPENVNMRTLIRYAEAVGMNLDVRLVAKKA
jgi:DNA-binding XRE family transcriptional regulator